MTTMAAEAPRSGFLRKLAELLRGSPSHEIARLGDAITQVTAAAGAVERAAARVERASKRIDMLGEMVEGMRAGPRARARKSRKRAKN